MTIRHFRIFVAVANTGKMCDAAEKLFISQPTVSQAIKELEEYYHTLLFERLGRKLHITKAGTELLFYATNLLNDFDNLDRKMLEISNHKHINIGATITIGNCILPDVINVLKSLHPNIYTYAQIANTEEIENQLLNSKLDIGLIEGNTNNPNLISIPVLEDSLVLACGKNHPFSKKPELKVEDLKNENFVFREKGSGTRKLFENYVNKYQIPINIALQSNCPGSIKNAIIKNSYISVISYRLIEEETKNGDIVFFRCSKKSWNRTLKIVYHKDKFLDKSLQDLIEITKNFDLNYGGKEIPSRLLMG